MGTYEYRKSLDNKETIEIENVVPKIVSEDLFNDCQDMIFRNGRNYYRSKRYLFIQRLVCPKCGRIMACNGCKNKMKKDYLYYKCKDCGTYIREELIEKALMSELNNLFELSNLISENYYITDKKTANGFNNCRLDHRLRFAIDESIIEEKRKALTKNDLNELWNMTSYETKCEFIGKYVDKITIKEYKTSRNKITSVEITDLKLKPNKVNELLDYTNGNMVDKIIGTGVYKASISTMKHEKDALEYIELLKKKHKIMVYTLSEDYDYYLDVLLFKIIKVKPKSVIEKEKTIYLYLTEPTNLLKKVSESFAN